jgi:uncharacterized membrane protein YdfJ with MMPL/SSD domain
MIECPLRVFNHLLILYKFVITVLIIVAMSLDITYNLLYVMHLVSTLKTGYPAYKL